MDVFDVLNVLDVLDDFDFLDISNLAEVYFENISLINLHCPTVKLIYYYHIYGQICSGAVSGMGCVGWMAGISGGRGQLNEQHFALLITKQDTMSLS